MPSWAAVCLVDFPLAINTCTWRSRSVSAKTSRMESRSGINRRLRWSEISMAVPMKPTKTVSSISGVPEFSIQPYSPDRHRPQGTAIGYKQAAPLVRDIHGSPHEAHKNGVFDQRRTGVLNPAILSAGALHAVLHTERAARGAGLQIGFQAEIAIVGMEASRPPDAQFLWQGAAAEFQPGPVEEGAHGIRPRHPYHYRRGVQEFPEALLTARLFLPEVVQIGFRFSQFEAEKSHFIDLLSGGHYVFQSQKVMIGFVTTSRKVPNWFTTVRKNGAAIG